MTVYTIGHSTRTIEKFIELLTAQNIKQLVDIRTVPKSRYNPQFMNEILERSLHKSDINYTYLKELGGLRPAAKNSINGGWRNKSFRNYADYMQTEEFRNGIGELTRLAGEATSVIMCAEAVPWRCHRSLVGDALLVRHIKVLDIISMTTTKEHTLTSFASVHGTRITYPPYEK